MRVCVTTAAQILSPVAVAEQFLLFKQQFDAVCPLCLLRAAKLHSILMQTLCVRTRPTPNTTMIVLSYGLSDDDVRARLFKRFEAYSYYSLSDLAKLEKLPQGRVREVLITIADREDEGEHRNKWSLKPALRT